ncbi:hypothetical protein [Paenibacillus sp. DMB5]|uniref:hypothetical protein n=1 Tax=Paenibacillus sp. DMB5 TaxID=1780103 RepID=UPI00076BF150|nr:hypothetical protein [Paenibacillus sp. DMB5]KUP22388.1 hypothetical protein AWJ19_27605 [Paenibacillus sp. DMB5]
MSHWFYITPEEYELAAAIGVDSENLNRRVRLLGWNKQRALTTPLEKKTDRRHWAEIARQNGIGYYTFMTRVNQWGWDEERAATEQLQDRKATAANGTEKIRKIPAEIIRLTEQNGIAYHTMRARIRKGWDPREAATLPVASHSDAGKLGKAAVIAKYGDWNKFSFKEPKKVRA